MTINLFFELIQVAIGHRDSLSRVLSANDWRVLYDFSEKQAVAGVLLWRATAAEGAEGRLA